MNDTNIYKPKDFAKLLGVSVKTLQRWDSAGRLKAFRNPANRRYYTHEQYLAYKGISVDDGRETVIYARVSSRGQHADLDNQTEFLRQFCNARGMIVGRCLQDIGSGLNYKRKYWNGLLDDVMDHKVKTIVISHKDRFVRFGFDWFESFCQKFGTEILVVNNEKTSPDRELVDDILSIIHVFSCRLYGLQKYKAMIKEDGDIAKVL